MYSTRLNYNPYSKKLEIIPVYYTSYGDYGVVIENKDFDPKMRIFVLILFIYHILYTIGVILCCSLTLDSQSADECYYFLFFFAITELIYYFFTLRFLIKKNVHKNKCCYSIVVFCTSLSLFISAIILSTVRYHPTTAQYIVFLGGTSLMELLSFLFSLYGFIHALE